MTREKYTTFAFREKAMREALQAYLDKNHPGLVLHDFVFSGYLEVKVMKVHVPEPEPASRSQERRLNMQKGDKNVD